MSKNLNYVFIASYVDQKANSDKVWGIIELVPQKSSYDTGVWVTFWGRRGSKYQTKVIKGTGYWIHEACEAKLDKGYKKIRKDRLDKIYPDFEKDLEICAFWTVLTKAGDLGEKAFDYVKEKTDIMN